MQVFVFVLSGNSFLIYIIIVTIHLRASSYPCTRFFILKTNVDLLIGCYRSCGRKVLFFTRINQRGVFWSQLLHFGWQVELALFSRFPA